MVKSDDELRMLADLPININDACSFYVPTLREIIDIGESEYNRLMSLLLISKDMVEGLKDGEDISNLDVAYINCYHNEEFKNSFIRAMKIFTKEEVGMSPEELGLFFYFGEIDKGRILDSGGFDYLQSLVMVANNVVMDKEEKYNPANEEVARVIREMEERKKKIPKPKKLMNLHSMISGMAWKSNDLNISNIFDLTIYCFYDGFFAMQNIDSYHFTFTGLYTGNIDGKKLDTSKIHWANIIENNKEEF